jgi:hypothetical protein
MKITTTLFMALSLLISACGGKGDSSKNLDPGLIKDNHSMIQMENGAPDGMPEITFEKNAHHFGDIFMGEKVVTEFKFRNTGNANLILTEANGDCGCTTPSYSKDPIPPGGEGFVKVSFDSNGKPGNQVKNVTVKTNAADGTTKLTISANVLQN